MASGRFHSVSCQRSEAASAALITCGRGRFCGSPKKAISKNAGNDTGVGFFFFVVIQCLFVVILFNLW